MTAPDLSPAEAAIVARFEAAPTPPEVLREQLITALADSTACDRLGHEGAEWCNRHGGDWPCFAGRAADAALAVFRNQQDPAAAIRTELLTIADMAAERERVEGGDTGAAFREFALYLRARAEDPR